MRDVFIWQFIDDIFNRAFEKIINLFTIFGEFLFNIKKSGNGRPTGNRLVSVLPYHNEFIFWIALQKILGDTLIDKCRFPTSRLTCNGYQSIFRNLNFSHLNITAIEIMKWIVFCWPHLFSIEIDWLWGWCFFQIFTAIFSATRSKEQLLIRCIEHCVRMINEP